MIRARRLLAIPAAAALASAACGYVSFSRPVSDDEIVIKQELRGYYEKVAEAFAAGNADALASLFSPSITHPMTQPELREWALKFFAEHRNAHFKIAKLEFESISFVKASVVVTYSVETPDRAGGFGGVERDGLVRDHGRWYVSSWDKADKSDQGGIETIFRRR